MFDEVCILAFLMWADVPQVTQVTATTIRAKQQRIMGPVGIQPPKIGARLQQYAGFFANCRARQCKAGRPSLRPTALYLGGGPYAARENRPDPEESLIGEHGERWFLDSAFEQVETVVIDDEILVSVEALKFVRNIVTQRSITDLIIISNGPLSDTVLGQCRKMRASCLSRAATLRLHLILCVADGITDAIRYQREIQGSICDSYNVRCLVTQRNVNMLFEMADCLREAACGHDFLLADTVHAEHLSKSELQRFHCSAREFFHKQIFVSTAPSQKYLYYAQFRHLTDISPKRLLGCAWQDSGIAIDSQGHCRHCPMQSDSFASICRGSVSELLADPASAESHRQLIAEKCSTCVWSCHGRPTIRNAAQFFRYLIDESVGCSSYRLWRP